MTSKPKTPEELLRELLSHFFMGYNGSLTWSYREDVELNDIAGGAELEKELLPYWTDPHK